MHSTRDHSRVVQINPCWTNCDESFAAELSFFQNLDSTHYWQAKGTGAQRRKYRSWGNDGEKNNFAASLGIECTPAFFCSKLTLWDCCQYVGTSPGLTITTQTLSTPA